MLVHLDDGPQVLVSSLAWAGISLAVGWWALRWPPERLTRTGPLTTIRFWEHGGAWWQRHLRVRRWKDILPEAGWVMPGGRSMRHLEARTFEGLVGFRCETIRAERVHWLIWSSLVLHLIWCRPTVFAGMAVFAIGLNAPFIVIQRYNRGRLDALIMARTRRSQPPSSTSGSLTGNGDVVDQPSNEQRGAPAGGQLLETDSRDAAATVMLALREIRRSIVRFGLLVAAIALLVFLILFQQALRDGLITSFVGAIRNQSAPVLVYNVDALRTLQASTISPELEQKVDHAKGVGRTALVGQSTFTVEVNRDGESDAAIIGTDDGHLVRPTRLSSGRRPAARGEAVGSAADFALGDKVEVVPSIGGKATTMKVVGLAQDIQLSVTPTLFTDYATFGLASSAANPDSTKRLPNAIAVLPDAGVSPTDVVAAINASSPDADSLTRADAAAKSPGVAQVRQSFQVIFLLYGLVVPLVTGLFFLIVTLQKARSLTLLRAIGARSSVLVRSLLTQVVIIVGLGLALGVALFFPVSQSRVGGLMLRFDPVVVLTWSALLLVLALLSAVASLRRVLRIDPIAATTGGGGR